MRICNDKSLIVNNCYALRKQQCDLVDWVLELRQVLVEVVDILEQGPGAFMLKSFDSLAISINRGACIDCRPYADREETDRERRGESDDQTELQRMCPLTQLQTGIQLRKPSSSGVRHS